MARSCHDLRKPSEREGGRRKRDGANVPHETVTAAAVDRKLSLLRERRRERERAADCTKIEVIGQKGKGEGKRKENIFVSTRYRTIRES